MESTRSYRASRSERPHSVRRQDPSLYVHGSTVPAYRPEQRPDFGVIPGRRAQSEVVELPASIMSIARIVVVVALIVAAIACVRVALSAMSINTSITTSELSSQIEVARTTGNDLEVMQTQLSSSALIEIGATSLGMAAPEETSVITLSPDVVATDDEGNLSLSGSISAIANAG